MVPMIHWRCCHISALRVADCSRIALALL
jgi:hypothetical protein